MSAIQSSVAAALALLAVSLATAATRYTVIDLGPYSRAVALNDSGEVVGEMRTADGSTHAFLFSGGKMQDLGTLNGGDSLAKGINDAHEVVGMSWVVHITYPDGKSRRDVLRQGFIWRNGVMRPIQPSTSAVAELAIQSGVDINDRGVILAETQPMLRGVIVENGLVTDLGTLIPVGVSYPMGKAVHSDGSSTPIMGNKGGYLISRRMNANSEVVGEAKIQSGSQHAFLYSHGVLSDIGTAVDKNSGANDINRSGQIVGMLQVGADDRHAFLYSGGTITDLGVPSAFKYSVANGINDAGDIVGTAYSYTGGGFLWISIDSRPYLYEHGRWEDLSAAVDLTGTGLDHLSEAVRINNRGQIIGQAMGKGSYRGYLLTPL